MEKDIIQKISDILEKRKNKNPADSYVKALYDQGREGILKKVEEEALELLQASNFKGENRKEKIVHEVADLWFHTLVLLSYENIKSLEILKELEKRFGISGIVEKASRQDKL